MQRSLLLFLSTKITLYLKGTIKDYFFSFLMRDVCLGQCLEKMQPTNFSSKGLKPITYYVLVSVNQKTYHY